MLDLTQFEGILESHYHFESTTKEISTSTGFVLAKVADGWAWAEINLFCKAPDLLAEVKANREEIARLRASLDATTENMNALLEVNRKLIFGPEDVK